MSESQRKKLNSEVQKFLDNGGTITKIPYRKTPGKKDPLKDLRRPSPPSTFSPSKEAAELRRLAKEREAKAEANRDPKYRKA